MQRKVNKKKKTYINCSAINIAMSCHFSHIISGLSIHDAENLVVLQISPIKVAGHLKPLPVKYKNFEWLPLPLEK
jgi:hypothetical protein